MIEAYELVSMIEKIFPSFLFIIKDNTKCTLATNHSIKSVLMKRSNEVFKPVAAAINILIMFKENKELQQKCLLLLR